jgi:hypothetical protein
MGRLNRKLILYNVSEAREELERIEALAKGDEKLVEEHLAVMFEHAYHHLNCAWNARRVPMSRYRHLTNEDFNAWGQFPTDLELPTLAEGD